MAAKHAATRACEAVVLLLRAESSPGLRSQAAGVASCGVTETPHATRWAASTAIATANLPKEQPPFENIPMKVSALCVPVTITRTPGRDGAHSRSPRRAAAA